MLDVLEKPFRDPLAFKLGRIFKNKNVKIKQDLVKNLYLSCIEDIALYIKNHKNPNVSDILQIAINAKWINIFFFDVSFLQKDVEEKCLPPIMNALPVVHSILNNAELSDINLGNNLTNSANDFNELSLIFMAYMSKNQNINFDDYRDLKTYGIFEQLKSENNLEEDFILPNVKFAFTQTRILSFNEYINGI